MWPIRDGQIKFTLSRTKQNYIAQWPWLLLTSRTYWIETPVLILLKLGEQNYQALQQSVCIWNCRTEQQTDLSRSSPEFLVLGRDLAVDAGTCLGGIWLELAYAPNPSISASAILLARAQIQGDDVTRRELKTWLARVIIVAFSFAF